MPVRLLLPILHVEQHFASPPASNGEGRSCRCYHRAPEESRSDCPRQRGCDETALRGGLGILGWGIAVKVSCCSAASVGFTSLTGHLPAGFIRPTSTGAAQAPDAALTTSLRI